MPPVPSAAAKGAAGKPSDAPAGRNPRERRLKDAGGGGGGAPAPPGKGAKAPPGEGGGKKEELKNARQKELAVKAAERRGNR